MGEVIPMDGLRRGAKPKENKDLKDSVSGGRVIDEQGRNTPENIGHPTGGVSRGEPGSAGSEKSPPGSVSRNAGPTGAAGGSGGMSKGNQKALQGKLKQLQKNAPTIGKKLAGGVIGKVSLGLDIFKQIEWSRDWMFGFVLFPFALLKDLIDIAFAGLAAIPYAGLVFGGVGVVVSFIMAIMVLILTVVSLLIAGSDLKNRGLAKYFITIPTGAIIESIPGLDWLPMAFITALLVYGLTLFDRLMAYYEKKNEGKESGQADNQETQPQSADSYSEKKAA